ADDLTGGHPVGGEVADVPLEPDQSACSGQCLLIQAQVSAAVADEPGLAGRLVAGDDGPRLVLLQGQGAPVPGGSRGRVCPDGAPVPRMGAWVPDRLGAYRPRPGAAGAGPVWGDGLDDLPVGEGITGPVEVRGQVPGGLGHP